MPNPTTGCVPTIFGTTPYSDASSWKRNVCLKLFWDISKPIICRSYNMFCVVFFLAVNEGGKNHFVRSCYVPLLVSDLCQQLRDFGERQGYELTQCQTCDEYLCNRSNCNYLSPFGLLVLVTSTALIMKK